MVYEAYLFTEATVTYHAVETVPAQYNTLRLPFEHRVLCGSAQSKFFNAKFCANFSHVYF